jgi:transcriptional regulator with PAS, ATPase and Fis domain
MTNVRSWINAGRTVVVVGETGVGKSSFIRSFAHELGKEFIQVNVNNFSLDLLESELFGHRKGAFTGASSDKLGLCEKIGNGILFLDEIGELPESIQVKLLLLLEERVYRSVGSNEIKRFKGTICFATHKNLFDLVQSGRMRKDFYFRINTYQHSLEPLRSLPNKHHIIQSLLFAKLEDKNLNHELKHFLFNYQWPGNFRELLNVIDYLSFDKKQSMGLDSLPFYLKETKTESFKNDKNYHIALERFESSFFRKRLKECKFHITNCAKEIGISKVTLIAKIKKYNLKDYISENKVSYRYEF